MNNHQTPLIIAAVLALALGFGLGYFVRPSVPASLITNFESCANAGNPVMESYPRQCRTADGRLFVEEITPPAMDHSAHNMMQMQMDDMSAGLKGKTGDEFDRAFLDEMVIHHQGAVEMSEQVLATSKRPELLQLARDIIKAQNSEIQMMQKWRAEWFQ